MTKEEFFNLSFDAKCQFISSVRQKIYQSNTKEERDAAVPIWIIEMVKDFEKKYKFTNFNSLFLGSFLLMRSDEDNEEVVCILNEIYDNQLHLTIMELDHIIGLSWSKITEEDSHHE